MTLLAAVHDDVTHTTLVAADSLVIWSSAGYGDADEKLYQLGDAIAWGYYGGSTPGLQFIEFLAECTKGRGFATWGDLDYRVRGAAEQLNRAHIAQGGFAALFAGRIKDKWGMCAVGGHCLRSENDEWRFVGQNRLAAKVAWQVATPEPFQDRFETVMNAVIDASPHVLEPPLRMWCITSDSCKPVLPPESSH